MKVQSVKLHSTNVGLLCEALGLGLALLSVSATPSPKASSQAITATDLENRVAQLERMVQQLCFETHSSACNQLAQSPSIPTLAVR